MSTTTGFQLERQCIRFLRKLGFQDVDGGGRFLIGGKQVDACGGHEDTLVIVECVTQSNINKKIDDIQKKYNLFKENIKLLRKYKSYKNIKLVVFVGNAKLRPEHYAKAKTGAQKVYLWDDKYISYFNKLASSINEYAIFNLLADMDIKPASRAVIKVPAFSADIGSNKDKLFLFFAEAKELLKIAYVARREAGGETFYQRMAKKERLKIIAKYIERGKVFPNSIIIALDKNSWKFQDHTLSIKSEKFEVPSWERVGELKIGNKYNSCWIIDGQHRLLSYTHANSKGFLPVAAFAEINEETQAQYFLDINREAKPVSPDLLWDLLGSINPDSTEGIISNSVKKMNLIKGGFLEHQINIPSVGVGEYHFNNLCVSIEKSEIAEETIGTSKSRKRKNPFFDKNSTKFAQNIAKHLDAFFDLFDQGLKSKVKQNIYSDGLLSSLITIYKYFIAHLIKKPSITDTKKFLDPLHQFFNAYDTDDIKVLKKNLSSEGGKSEFKNELIKVLQEGYDKNFGAGIVTGEKNLGEQINDLEHDLNQWVNSIMEKEVGTNWVDDQRYFNDAGKRKAMIDRAKKFNAPFWEFMDFNISIQILTKHEIWSKYAKQLFTSEMITSSEELRMIASKLWEYRSNKVGHKRSHIVVYSRNAENIIKNYYQIFSKVVFSELDKLK